MILCPKDKQELALGTFEWSFFEIILRGKRR
jgi:hypothetical protein